MASKKSINQMALPIVHRLWRKSQAKIIAAGLADDPIGERENEDRCLLLGRSSVTIVNKSGELECALFTADSFDVMVAIHEMNYHRTNPELVPLLIEAVVNMHRPIARNLFIKAAGLKLRVGDGVRGLWKLSKN